MLPLEAMLSLLIFAILGIPTFSESDYHGTKHNNHFCTYIPEGEVLTGVEMTFRGRAISSIQMQYDHIWGKIYGVPGRSPVISILKTDEHILAVSGTYDGYIFQVVLTTNRQRQLMFGSYVGPHEFLEYPKKEDHVFKGFCAYFGPGGLKAILPVFGTVNGTCTG